MKINRTILFICLIISLTACGNPIPTVVAEPEGIRYIEEIPVLDESETPILTQILSPSDGDILPFEAYLLRFEGAAYFGISEFEVRVDNIVLGNVPAIYSGSGGMTGHWFYGEMLWTPQSTGTHLIAVRARGGNNQLYTQPDEVEVTVMHARQEVEFTPPPLLNTPTPTTVSPMPFYARIMKLSLCWIGPGDLYEVVSSLQPGTQVDLLGTGEAPGYLVVNNPLYRVPCWVEEEDVDTSGLDLSGLPVFNIPPLPTRTPIATPKTGCLVPQGVGAADKCEVPCPDPIKYPQPCVP